MFHHISFRKFIHCHLLTLLLANLLVFKTIALATKLFNKDSLGNLCYALGFMVTDIALVHFQLVQPWQLALSSVVCPSHDTCQCPELYIYLCIVDFLYKIQREPDLCNAPPSAPNGARLLFCPTQTGT